MNKEKTEMWLRKTKHIRGHLWHSHVGDGTTFEPLLQFVCEGTRQDRLLLILILFLKIKVEANKKSVKTCFKWDYFINEDCKQINFLYRISTT